MKALLMILGALVALVAATAFCLLEWPGIVLNPRTVAWATRAAARQLDGLEVQYDRIATKVESVSFFEKRLRVRFEGLCAFVQASRQEGEAMRSCFRTVDLAFAYRFGARLPYVTELGPVAVLGGDVFANLPRLQAALGESPDSSPSDSPEDGRRAGLPDWIEQARLEPMDVRIDRFRIESETGAQTGSVALTARQGELDLDASVDLGPGGKARVTLLIDPEGDGHYQYRVSGRYASTLISTRFETLGGFGPDGVRGTLSQDIRVRSRLGSTPVAGPLTGLSHVQLRDCRYEYVHVAAEGLGGGKIRVGCPVHLELPRASKSLALEGRPLIRISTDLDAPFPPDAQGEIAGRVSLEPGKALSPAVRMRGGMRIDLSFVPADLPRFRALDGRLRLSVDIPRFERLAAGLSGTLLALPAPMPAMRGAVKVDLRGRLSPEGARLTTRLESRLASPRRSQLLSVDARSTVRVDMTERPVAADLKLGLLLRDVRLTLPKLDAGSLPQLLPDPRLAVRQVSREVEEKAKKVATKLSYEISARTPPGKPLRIDASVLDAQLPVHLDVVAKNPSKLKGWIRVDGIPVNIPGKAMEEGGVLISLDTARQRGSFQGGVQVEVRQKTSTRVPPPQIAGEAAGQDAPERVGPKFSLPFTRIVSSLLLGTPLEEFASEAGVESRPAGVGEPERVGFLEMRRRF